MAAVTAVYNIKPFDHSSALTTVTFGLYHHHVLAFLGKTGSIILLKGPTSGLHNVTRIRFPSNGRTHKIKLIRTLNEAVEELST